MKKVLRVAALLLVLVTVSCSMGLVDQVAETDDSIVPSAGIDPSRAVSSRPLFQMPVPGGETWTVATYTGHNPLLATDLNWGSTAEADFGRTIVASYGGTVRTSAWSTTSGYGNYVVIDHGNGWTTWYCHLNSRSVSAGQSVSRGQKIGTCGHSSALYTMSTHLHYEQRLYNSLQYIYFNGSQIPYYAKVQRTSNNYSYSTYYVKTAGASLTIRSGPGTGYAAVGSVANGAGVHIYSQAYGSTVTGTYGTTSIWDHIDGGYISDAYVYTGSDGLVAPLE